MEPTTTLFDQVATTFGGQENLDSNTTFNLTKPGPIIYEDEHFQSKSSNSTANNTAATGAANVADIPAAAPATSNVFRSALVK